MKAPPHQKSSLSHADKFTKLPKSFSHELRISFVLYLGNAGYASEGVYVDRQSDWRRCVYG